jgi:phosphatidylglycerophosphate synthase
MVPGIICNTQRYGHTVLDLRLRTVKDRALRPVAASLAGRVAPLTLSVIGMLLCVGAGVLAWQSAPLLAVCSWLAGRLLDGLDGPVARSRGRESDIGGFADLLLDTIGYAAVPLGVAAGANDLHQWAIVAALLATFYVNAVSLLLLSSILEKRSNGRAHSGETTTVTLPPALIEGAETIVLFTLALAIPAWADTVFVIMALGVVVSVLQRAVIARRLLV